MHCSKCNAPPHSRGRLLWLRYSGIRRPVSSAPSFSPHATFDPRELLDGRVRPRCQASVSYQALDQHSISCLALTQMRSLLGRT
jgi:hypothetical protein